MSHCIYFLLFEGENKSDLKYMMRILELTLISCRFSCHFAVRVRFTRYSHKYRTFPNLGGIGFQVQLSFDPTYLTKLIEKHKQK